MKNVFFAILIILFLVSCDEVNKVISPDNELIIEKEISVSSVEQVLQSGNDIKIVVPANSLNGNLKIEVSKLSSVPNLDIKDFKLGSNLFKIKFNGNTNVNKPLEISINYAPNLIKAGKTDNQAVRGFVYYKGTWYFADYELDLTNKKIKFYIEGFNVGKIKKNDVVLLDSEEEIIIGDGYSTTDQGQNDEFLEKINKSIKVSIKFWGIHKGLNNNKYSTLSVPDVFNFGSDPFSDTLHWSKNEFTDYRDNYYSIIGTINSEKESVSVTAEGYEKRIEDGDTISVYTKLILEDVPYFIDFAGFIHKFYIDGGGTKVSKRVKYVEYRKTIINEDNIEVYEYKGTDFTENAIIEIQFLDHD